MTLPVNLTNVVEVVVVTGSLILGFIVLATYWRERSGKLFGFLCLLLALWKGFEFADPELTTAAWVDSTGWALGALSIALAWHFVVSYTYRGYREPRLLWAAMYPAALLLAIPPFLGSLRLNTVYHACFTVNYMAGMGGIVALTFRAYLREKSREMIWAILGTLSIAIGAGIHIITLLLDLDPFHFHTYGMLGFELFFGYDIMVGGLLRIRREHLRALEELGLRERKLEMAEEGFRRLLESSFDILFTVDREGNILAISTEVEEIRGFRLRKLLGRGYLEFLTPQDRAKVADAVVRGMEGEKIQYMEITLEQPGARPLVVQITATRLKGEDGIALVIARDVTGARRMERELQERNLLLEEANRRLRELDTLKTELVGVVGHELRSPLTVIYSYAAALKDHWNKMEEERKLECIEHVLRECNRLNRMVENVLDLSRIESERLFLHRQRGDLVALLSDVTREMAMAPGARLIRLVTSVRHMEMEVDWDKIKQVVINLLDNAFRFSPPGSQVILTGDIMDGKAVVRVKDMGPGVPPEKRDRLFEKFTQSKAEGMERGLGLGLYIVRTFVEAHEGEVWLEDEQGLGTVIAFSLPLEAVSAEG
ncbi:MAG: ATP-binding protein [Actinomycetota bacterium]|nr:ATP-binding protein [Actinomycetota bacterium]